MYTVKGDVNGENDFFEVHVDKDTLQEIRVAAAYRGETITEYFNTCVETGRLIRLCTRG